MTRRTLTMLTGLGVIALGAGPTVAQNCANSSVGLTPLNDLGAGAYFGAQGGLYPSGANLRPTAHDDAGRARAQALSPLNAAGAPDPNGAIVLLSLGMSNTTQEFSTFIQQMQQFPNRHPRLRIVDGAQGGQDAVVLSNPNSGFWTIVNQRLAAAGLTPAQVQCVWLKEAIAGPANVAPGPFPAHAEVFQGLMTTIAQIVKDKFPNAALCYVSSRIYAGYATTMLNPEPYAYDSAFGVKWMIESQIAGAPALNFDAGAGPVEAAWLAWGPYLWADGLMARSDGLIWECQDFAMDGVHPSTLGRAKVATLLRQFFSRDLTTRPWFVARGADLNDDGAITFADLNRVLASFGQGSAGGAILPGDANADGAVDFADLNLVLSQFGT